MNDIALARVQRIAVCRHDHAQCRTPVPFHVQLVQRARGRGHHHVEQIGFQAHHDGLGFRVAHAAVELQRLGLALRIDHQPRIQKTGERNAVFFHALDGRQNDFAHGPRMHIGRDHRGGGVSAHAARVRAFVAVEQALVVLAGGQDGHVLAIAHDNETGFLALQKLLDDDACAAFVVGHAQRVELRVGRQHEFNGFVRFVQCHGHDHAFAGGQAIGLDHDRHAFFIDIRVGGHCVVESFVVGRRNVVALHEVFGKSLGAFQLRGRLGRAKHPQAMLAKLIHQASGQRLFRPNHCKCYFFCSSPSTQRLRISDIYVNKPGIKGGTSVARCHINRLHLGRLGQFPGQRMFTATAAHH